MTKITELELKVLNAIVDSDYQDCINVVNNWVWSWSANPWDGTPESRKFAAVLVSLIKKGLAKQDGEGRDACVCITEQGLAILKESVV